MDIIQYNKNRVKLQVPIDGDDYINASWITDGKTIKDNPCPGIAFIACQGPTVQTCPHHWQMIYENNVDVIVMLTKFFERKDGVNGYNGNVLYGIILNINRTFKI